MHTLYEEVLLAEATHAHCHGHVLFTQAFGYLAAVTGRPRLSERATGTELVCNHALLHLVRAAVIAPVR